MAKARLPPAFPYTPGPQEPSPVKTNSTGAARASVLFNILKQNPFLIRADFLRRYFFSITHCNGCWCLRAKSITCVTLVSAIS